MTGEYPFRFGLGKDAIKSTALPEGLWFNQEDAPGVNFKLLPEFLRSGSPTGV